MRARGWFFIQAQIFAYRPTGVVYGQGAQDSCLAAGCRMLLRDYGVELAEAYLRDALRLDQGSYLSQVPALLQAFKTGQDFVYCDDLTLDDLKLAVRLGSALVFVKEGKGFAGHALLVDEINESRVAIRDPLPLGMGKAYRVSVTDFVRVWLRPHNLLGRAVIIAR